MPQTLVIRVYKCPACGHIWVSRQQRYVTCPKCKYHTRLEPVRIIEVTVE